MSAMVIFSGAAVLAMAIAAFASAYSQGRTGAAAMDATWKKPEVAGKVRTTMMLALVFMEALTLFVFAIVFVLAGRVTNEIAVFTAVAVVSMAAAATGSVLAQAKTASAALEASWREPEGSGDTRTSMMLGLVFMEALTLFVFAIVFVLAGSIDSSRVIFGSVAVAGMALAAIGSATAQGRAASVAMEATWKQPDAAGNIRTSMMLGLVFMEALTLFVFAIVFVLAGSTDSSRIVFGSAAVAGMALAAIGSATAQGRATSVAMEATWKQPAAAGNIRTSMMLALVFMEALTLFVFAIVFVLNGRATTPAGNLFGAVAVAAMVIAAVGSALSQGKAGAAAMEATWRQPEAAADIRTSMMLALVFMEALTLFVFAIVFVLSGIVV